MSSGCGDVLSLEDLKTAKKHQTFEAEVITGKAGGVDSGADIDYATNQVTGQVQKTLPAILRDAGFRPASFTFTTGGTLTVNDADLAVLWPISDGGDGNYYAWKGTLPKTIPAGSTPASTGGVSSAGWVAFGDITVRGWAENRFQLKAFVPVQGASFTTGGSISSAEESLLDTATGLYWAYSGSLPKVVSPGSSPSSDSAFYAVGRLSPLYQINDSRNWYTPSSSVDNTSSLQLFLTAMTSWKMQAVLVGDVLTSSRVTFDCDVDASACTYYISPNSDNTVSGGGGKVWLLEDANTVVLTGQSFATSNIGQTSHIQLSGAQFSNTTVGVEGEGTSNRAYYRGTFGTYTNAFDLYVMDGGTTGMHPDTEALFKFNDTAKFTVRPLRPRRTIYGPTFVLSAPLSGGRSLRTCIAVERNNTAVIGGYFNAQQNSVVAESYVQLTFVTDCIVEGVSMPNGVAAANYLVLAHATNHLIVKNCHAPSGWALVDGNFMRNTVVEDSSGATIGCHAMAWNFFVERCTLHPVVVNGKYQGGISLTGGGLLKVRDITYTYMGGDRNLDHPVSTRGDYGQSWEGVIDIDGLTVRYGAIPVSGQGMAIVYANGADFGSTDLSRSKVFLGGKKLSIRNVEIQILNASWTTSQIVINPAWFQTTFTQNVQYPLEYIIENFEVTLSGLPTNAFTMDPRWPLLVSNAAAVQSTCRMYCNNVRWPNNSILFAGAAAATTYRVNPELIIENSKSSLYINLLAIGSGGIARIRNTFIGNLTLGNANSAGRYYLDQCSISGTNFGGSPAGSDVAYYTQNHITTTSAVNIGSVAKYCHGNTVVAGGSITGRTVDEWYSYRDPSVFRTS